nr:hypothetical protein [Streptomyces sp. S1D4-11]
MPSSLSNSVIRWATLSQGVVIWAVVRSRSSTRRITEGNRRTWTSWSWAQVATTSRLPPVRRLGRISWCSFSSSSAIPAA